MNAINGVITIIFGLVFLIYRNKISASILSQHLKIWGKNNFDKKANRCNFLMVKTMTITIGWVCLIGGISLFLEVHNSILFKIFTALPSWVLHNREDTFHQDRHCEEQRDEAIQKSGSPCSLH